MVTLWLLYMSIEDHASHAWPRLDLMHTHLDWLIFQLLHHDATASMSDCMEEEGKSETADMYI